MMHDSLIVLKSRNLRSNDVVIALVHLAVSIGSHRLRLAMRNRKSIV
jgi:hypothetical protein